MGVACNLGGELLERSAGAAAHGGIPSSHGPADFPNVKVIRSLERTSSWHKQGKAYINKPVNVQHMYGSFIN